MPSPNFSAPQWKRKHTWIVVGLAVALLAAGFLVLSLDESPPDTRDLRREVRLVANEANAFVQLVHASELIDRSPWASDSELFSAVARGHKWDAAKAAAWLAANEHLWNLITQSAALPQSQGPVPTSIADGTFKQVGPLRELAELATLRAWHLYHTRGPDAALEWLVTWLRAAQRIEDSNSMLIVWLTGLSLHTSGRQTIDAMVARALVSATTGRRVIQALEETRPSARSLANVLAGEHGFTRIALNQVRDNTTTSVGDKNADRMLATSRYLSLLYKPNQTERLSAESFRAIIAHVDSDLPTLQAAMARHGPRGKGGSNWNFNNATGRVLLDMITPSLQGLLVKRLRTQSAISATEALIAVRMYEIEHGSLPRDLAATVPALLLNVPRDYFDGALIRYSPEFRAIWSVGENQLTITSREDLPSSREVFLRIPVNAP